MAASTLANLGEIFVQFADCNNVYDILLKHKIIVYFIYENDVLLVYSEEYTDINLFFYKNLMACTENY
jgi:hypothetical protein